MFASRFGFKARGALIKTRWLPDGSGPSLTARRAVANRARVFAVRERGRYFENLRLVQTRHGYLLMALGSQEVRYDRSDLLGHFRMRIMPHT
jgi:hypothetical protein